MIDRQTGRSRGFGFVRFATAEGVEAALQTPHLLDGQWIDVKRAQPAENLPPPKITYPRTRAEMEGEEQDENDFEPKLPTARSKQQPRVESALPQHNANELNAYADPHQLQSAYMAGMAAQSWLQMSQQFNPMTGFYPPFYPTPGVPAMGAAADIPALLASMGMQVPEIPPVEKKEQPKREKKEQPKKEQPKQRAELGALSFKLPAAPAEDKKAGLPLAALASSNTAPFMDVSNVIEAQPSPTKMSVSSPVRRGTTPVPDQENPQVVV